ncbi:hypothetical protein MPTK1_2g02930 [Marchantia polymorpha subsp. ruderalis]|uniref:Uncharacterized protein n=1 Tax=Marchantia polymorpha TaxID=3197 RepID=A0A2R6WM72_MARPO|nr:hypothetical protein MARPO_0075s0054 [Marchantia polymorpha]BBN00895.1 hypothetical protein Mp_2g02930 [Marchantia polymorpha subsp. ruderalis]|eukprot:PTQ34949.1 hypothetical protein MARPO_0075s0054 [Marchantia polymorpha]
MGTGKIFLGLTLLLTLAPLGTNAGPFGSSLIVGRRFNVVNEYPAESLALCPEGNPNSAVFYRNGTVKITGNFVAANIGVCSTQESQYGVPPTTTISYKVYGDMVVFKVQDRVASALRVFNENKKIVSVGLSGYSVSQLTNVGPA